MERNLYIRASKESEEGGEGVEERGGERDGGEKQRHFRKKYIFIDVQALARYWMDEKYAFPVRHIPRE